MVSVSKLLLALPLFATALASDLSIVPISGTSMGAVQLADGNTRLYYQDSTTGAINAVVVSNVFTTGQSQGVSLLVPQDEVRKPTPVAVSLIAATGLEFVQLHVFFFSPENILSEYHWNETIGLFQGGASCVTCITNEGFVGVAGSDMLYAMANNATSPPTLRVGFVSAGSPGTISEAVNTGNGWSIASLTT
ncbi:hypothetical protein BDP27DRAFT_1373696 [Rhodocollybia butyracea]|uniref:Uncharacterized protein n=1 Tax=Rhodocollybia butyracea TaxID=206335 RepID=A0A9P5P7J8_9AGAR|nr:hypothetical protein BDP27DRAFT_1373696 [Rhodocollybia butyracea]